MRSMMRRQQEWIIDTTPRTSQWLPYVEGTVLERERRLDHSETTAMGQFSPMGGKEAFDPTGWEFIIGGHAAWIRP
jgi:hypothetical protein